MRYIYLECTLQKSYARGEKINKYYTIKSKGSRQSNHVSNVNARESHFIDEKVDFF